MVYLHRSRNLKLTSSVQHAALNTDSKELRSGKRKREKCENGEDAEEVYIGGEEDDKTTRLQDTPQSQAPKSRGL